VRSDRISIVICDAGPVIHLDELGELGLLADFGKVLITETVLDEVARHRTVDWQGIPLSISPPPPVDPRLRAVSKTLSLHSGEISALALGALHPDALFLTDDSAARMASEQMGFRVHGTLGVLLRSVRRGIRTTADVRKLLLTLPSRSTLHLRPDLLARVIAELDGYHGSQQ